MRHRQVIRTGRDVTVLTGTVAVLMLFALLGANCPIALQLPPPTPQPGLTDVLIQNGAFLPQIVGIKRGESVRWTNLDPFLIHTVTSGDPQDADAGSLFDSGELAPNGIFIHRFDTAGEFPYFSRSDPIVMVNARVIVAP